MTHSRTKRGRSVATVALAAAVLLVGLCWIQRNEILSWYYFRFLGFASDPADWPMWGGSLSRNLVNPRVKELP